MVRENAAILMRCGKCNQQVMMNQMKYAKDGKTLICQQCQGLKVQEHIAALRAKTQPTTAPKRSQSGMKYKCTSCGFNFARQNIKPTRCPYCAKPTIIEAGQIKVEKLLDDSDGYD